MPDPLLIRSKALRIENINVCRGEAFVAMIIRIRVGYLGYFCEGTSDMKSVAVRPGATPRRAMAASLIGSSWGTHPDGVFFSVLPFTTWISREPWFVTIKVTLNVDGLEPTPVGCGAEIETIGEVPRQTMMTAATTQAATTMRRVTRLVRTPDECGAQQTVPAASCGKGGPPPKRAPLKFWMGSTRVPRVGLGVPPRPSWTVRLSCLHSPLCPGSHVSGRRTEARTLPGAASALRGQVPGVRFMAGNMAKQKRSRGERSAGVTPEVTRPDTAPDSAATPWEVGSQHWEAGRRWARSRGDA